MRATNEQMEICRRWVFGLLVISILSLFAACSSSGGGVDGTGLTRIQGILLDDNEQPIANSSVTSLDDGVAIESTSTNEDGSFEIRVAAMGILEFEAPGAPPAQFSASTLPPAEELAVDFKRQNNSVTAIRVEVVSAPPPPTQSQPTAQPTVVAPTATSTAVGQTPLPTSTPAGTVAPTATVTPTATATPKPPEYGLGDLNCDGITNHDDVDPFVLALVNAEDYANQYPNCDRDLADCNKDGNVDFFDIDAFNALLPPR